MRQILYRLLVIAITTFSLLSCSQLQQVVFVPDETVKANQYAVAANLELKKLKHSDALIQLDNALLTAEIQSRLRQISSQFAMFGLQQISVRFEQQFIRLTTQLQFNDADGNVLLGEATGRVTLEISGDRLEWFPVFQQFKVITSAAAPLIGRENRTRSQLDQPLLEQLNSELNSRLRVDRLNHINLHPIPLGNVEVGARLVTFDNATAVQTAPLNGVFFVTGSAMLINKSTTSILLDLGFVPDLAVCPADVDVSRAVFSRTIDAREPVDIANNLDPVDDMRVFYSEISGATRPMTIIHYWFADGQPVAVEELPVGPSERWRTWSTRESTAEQATHWRVLVVEKESGCILHSQSIRSQALSTSSAAMADTVGMDNQNSPIANPAISEVAIQSNNPSNDAQVVDDFAVYQTAFGVKASVFPVRDQQKHSVSIDIKRDYLGQVFQTAISDLQIETAFSQTDLPAKRYNADLLPFETGDIVCEEQKCANPLVCTTNVAHCKRLRDTRECSSCLFHNPLNNRCLQTAEDPICVAAKNRQNMIYQQDREACIAAAENSRNDCQQLSNQIAQSCEIESRVEKSACEASKAEINSFDAGSILAGLSAESRIQGQLSTHFSNFRISPDLTQIQQNITLKTEMNINGQLDFQPKDTDWLLSNCINAWSGPFTNRAMSSTPLNSMLTTLSSKDSVLKATWSGIVLPLKMTASPLESTFVGNPQLLAGCSIGLTVDKVEQAIVGRNADFFTGSLNLIIQPLPTRLSLNNALIELDSQTLEGTALISDDFVSYELE